MMALSYEARSESGDPVRQPGDHPTEINSLMMGGCADSWGTFLVACAIARYVCVFFVSMRTEIRSIAMIGGCWRWRHWLLVLCLDMRSPCGDALSVACLGKEYSHGLEARNEAREDGKGFLRFSGVTIWERMWARERIPERLMHKGTLHFVLGAFDGYV
jgi:hypothetical protein